MKNRYISAQVLLNKDGTMKAQRVYAIPEPSVVSFYVTAIQMGDSGMSEFVRVGVMVQDWKTREISDNHPDTGLLFGVLRKHFGLTNISMCGGYIDYDKKA